MTSQNNRAPLLCYVYALCIIPKPSVNSNWTYNPETLDLGQNRRFLSRVNFKFDRWPWNTTGHVLYATSGFVYHFIAIGQFKLELQSGNSQFGSKSTIFFCPVRPWNLTDDLEIQYATSSSVHHVITIRTGVTVRKRQIWTNLTKFRSSEIRGLKYPISSKFIGSLNRCFRTCWQFRTFSGQS